MIMQILLKNLLVVICLLFSLNAKAERFSYVYIQGDKHIPFYVKLGDDMLPRYSKNYCIIPQLAAGPIRLQILFQQNQYPPQTFHVQVPQNGHRGFLLTKVDDGFALYDIQQRFYLLPGEEGEDHLPDVNSSASAYKSNDVIVSRELQQTEPTSQNKDKYTLINNTTKKNFTKEPPPVTATNEPQFMDGVELSNDSKPVRNVPEKDIPEEIIVQEKYIPEVPAEEMVQQPVITETITNTPQKELTEQRQTTEPANIANDQSVEETGMHDTEEEMKQPVPTLADNAAPIINSDCSQPMSDTKFDDVFTTSRAKNDDDKRIGYLMKKAGENCFTTRQAFLLSRQLQAESMRYSFLKKVYPRITDQQNFHLLADALFKTMEWKSYFKSIYE